MVDRSVADARKTKGEPVTEPHVYSLLFAFALGFLIVFGSKSSDNDSW
jgi:hypothetical protein